MLSFPPTFLFLIIVLSITLSDFAPNPQKARKLLHVTEIPYSQCLQPWTQPRPILLNLGATYRRSPVLSIGKDVYCDNSVFFDAIQTLPIFTEDPNNKAPLRTSPADKAYEAFGYQIFWTEITLALPHLITPELAKDREHVARMYITLGVPMRNPKLTIRNSYLYSARLSNAQTKCTQRVAVYSPDHRE